MKAPLHTVKIFSPDAPLFDLNWYDGEEMPLGVVEAARYAVDATCKDFGPECVHKSGANERYVKVPEIGMVYIVVSSIAGDGSFKVHASKNESTMHEIYDDFYEVIGD